MVGAVYKHLGEMMKLLWGPDLHMNTVHVRDVVRAIWHVVNSPDTIGKTYNVVDEDDSTQGSISAIVSELFNINHDYWGTALSTLAKVWKKIFIIFFFFFYIFICVILYVYILLCRFILFYIYHMCTYCIFIFFLT